MKKHLLKSLLALVLVLISGSAWGDSHYEKTTSIDDLESGTYLIVYEEGNVAMNGSLTTLDAVSNTVAVTISEGTIASSTAVDAAVFTFDATKNTLKSASGYYIGQTSDANGLASNQTTAYTNTISFDDSGNVNIVGSGGAYLRYNSASNQIRFRYYKSSSYTGQKAIQLYKWIEESDPGDNSVATTATIDGSGINNTDVYTATAAGSLSATVAAGETTIDGATVTWSSSDESVATIGETTGVVTLVKAGTATITASYAGVENTYKPSTATYLLTVTNSDPSLPGREGNPYTVAEARAAIDTNGTIDEAYATGIIYQIDSYNSDYNSITYWISDDGTSTNPLEVYGGLAKEGEEEFSSKDDLVVGAKVVVKGELTKYNTTYEFSSNNRLVSIIYPVATPTFTLEAGTYETAQSVTINCATDGATIYYTLDGNEPSSTSPVFSTALSITETTTVKAIAVKDGYLDSQIATAVYTIAAIVNPTSVTVAPETAEVMVGETTTLTATVLPVDATYKEVTWESSVPAVATVSDEGVVTALTEGTTTITATSVADGTKMGTCTVTVVKADYDLLDNAFTGVTGTSYSDWTGKEGTYSGVFYKGQSAGGNSSIQLRSNNSNSGIVTTSFYGRATKIVVEWNSNTDSGRTLDIYGKSTAYSAATDLYDSSKQGTKLGSIVCGTSTELEIDDSAISDYIGLRSKSSAMYIDKIKIYWEQKTTTVTVSSYEWATASFNDRVVVPANETVYKVNGATDGVLNLVEVPEGKVIGKNVGVLLYKAGGGNLEFVITGDDADVLGSDTDNKLLATGDITTADYILGTYDGGFGFCHPSAAMTCTSGKAFLPASAVTGSSAPFLRIGGTTNVANVERIAEDNIYYDLMGRKVENPVRGIYILNGKKVLVK